VKKGTGKYQIRQADNARDAALYALCRILEEDCRSDRAVAEALELAPELSRLDRAFLLRLVNGCLERLVSIDHLVDRFSTRALTRLSPMVRCILRMSVYQILYMDKVPDSAACSEAVRLTALHGMPYYKGYVNAVLRTMVREKESGSDAFAFTEDWLKYSVPAWLYKKLSEDFGPERAAALGSAWLEPKEVLLRLVKKNGSREELESLMKGQGAELVPVDMEAYLGENGLSRPDGPLPVIYRLQKPGELPLQEMDAFRKGLFYVQDPASALVVSYAGLKKDDVVTDVCAAPGGKVLFAAELLEEAGGGRIEARDLSVHKTELIRENAERLGISNIGIRVLDALQEEEESYYRSDVLLADLPCTGLGIAAGKPDIKLQLKPYSIDELSELQRDILSVVSKYVKPHGRLVYSTCTVTREENEENVLWAAENLGFAVLSMNRIWPAKGQDGFFIAVLEKNY